MEPIHPEILERANDAAIYTLYLYLAHKTTPAEHETLQVIVRDLIFSSETQDWNFRDRYRLHILRSAVARSTALAGSVIGDLTRSKSGMTACSFTNPGGDVFVVFRGTGSGEWIDNGEGLSGIPEENTYITYGEDGNAVSSETVHGDHATGQQVEALNWFRRIAAQNRWNMDTRITLAGHSKGGNKAQFITIHADLVDACFSFDGQGFSPEALSAFKDQYGAEFTARRHKIRTLSADDDYVNVLGDRLMPDNRIYYFGSSAGLHYLEAMLDRNGKFHPQRGQGELSRYVERVSEKLMQMEPSIRQHAVLGIMNIFQTYLGEDTAVNGDTVSLAQTIAGLAVSIGTLLDSALF